MLCLLLLSFGLVVAAAEQHPGPGQAKLISFAEEASFLARHRPHVLLPALDWNGASTGGRHLHNVDSIPGQGACRFTSGKCIADGKYFAKVGAMADLLNAILDLDLCTSFDNFDGSCNDFVNPPGKCKTVSMGPVLGGRACVPANSSADGMDFQTGFSIRTDFGSLSAFLTEACTEGSVLDKTAPAECTPVWIALLRILGCDTCIRELGVVQGAVSDACGAFSTLGSCISDNATATARFVLCGDDPACASVSPNTVDNPLDIFYNNDYFNDYGDDATAPSEALAPGPTDYAAGSTDYTAGPSDYGTAPSGDYGNYDADYGTASPETPAADEGDDGVLEGQGEGSADYSVAPAPTDYSISGYDYGFEEPVEAPDYAAAYAPYVPFDYSADTPDVRDLLLGYLATTADDSYDSYAYAALPVAVDTPIYYGDEPFMLEPGNPWEGDAEAGAAAPPVATIPPAIRNYTTGGTTGTGPVV